MPCFTEGFREIYAFEVEHGTWNMLMFDLVSTVNLDSRKSLFPASVWVQNDLKLRGIVDMNQVAFTSYDSWVTA